LNPEVKETPLRSAGIVGVLTLASRILGMLESRVLAYYLGAGLAADAFFVAFRLPNLLRRFTAEGVMVAAFLPTVHEVESREGEEVSRAFVARFVGSLATLLVLLSFFGVLAMGLIVALMELGKVAPGEAWSAKLAALVRIEGGLAPAPPEWALAAQLGRIMFPYVVLVSVSAALGGVLNLRGRFALPAATPILWNVVVIALGAGLATGLGWVAPERAAVGFAVAVLAGGLAQLLLILPTYRSLGYTIRPGLGLADPAVVRTLRRMGPGVVGAGAYQINVLLSTLLASALPNGAQTVLFNSTMMGELVLGLFAVSLATVSLPLMTRQAEAADHDALRGSLSLALRSTALAALPAAVGLSILAQPIVALIFQTGKFGPREVHWTAETLAFQAVGIPFIAAARVMVPALYALKDYRGPVQVGLVSVAANLVLSLLLMPRLGTGGIALANGLASLLSVGLFAVLLERRLGALPLRQVLASWGHMALAAALMGLVAFVGLGWLELESFHGVLGGSARLFPLIALCVLVYGGVLLASGSPEAGLLMKTLKRSSPPQ
jgi:putative peptidoglycan lipid II flippase